MEYGKQIAQFFQSDYWAQVEKHLNNPDTHHVHVYVNTSIEPRDLEKALQAYLDARGWGRRRKIDHMAPKLGTGALHGIHPHGKPHFDIMFNYKADAVLEPMDPLDGEMGSNLVAWGTEYMNNYLQNYHFRPFDEAAGKALEDYFRSEHWHKGLETVLPDENVHVHINTETSIDPQKIKEYALQSLAARGWDIEEAVQCVFIAKGAYYQGKIVFLSNKPEKVFDISWKYNAKVYIIPTEDWIVWKDQAGCDVWTKQMLRETVLEKGVWKRLSDEDIRYIRENV
ncbi:MAG: hypothetical protein M1609_09250 [Firmicutes bacterium]|nr:hypothetical protein [Bacillota bacterium]